MSRRKRRPRSADPSRPRQEPAPGPETQSADLPNNTAAVPGREPPADRESSGSNPRRRFLGWIWAGLLAALTAEIAWVVASFLRPRGARGAADAALVVAGPVERFEPGTVTAFPGGKFYLARLDDGGFLALDRTCTHLGCTVPWSTETGRFECPCHASAFDITGAVLGPPAPRPLDLYPVRIENDIVKIDTSRRVRRRSFVASQVARV